MVLPSSMSVLKPTQMAQWLFFTDIPSTNTVLSLFSSHRAVKNSYYISVVISKCITSICVGNERWDATSSVVSFVVALTVDKEISDVIGEQSFVAAWAELDTQSCMIQAALPARMERM